MLTTMFYEWYSWLNNLGLALGMALKFYAKGLKLKLRKFWGLISTLVAPHLEYG